MAKNVIDITELLEARKVKRPKLVGVQAVDGEVCVVLDQRVLFHDDEGGRSLFVMTLQAAREFLDLIAVGIVEADRQKGREEN